MLFNFNLYSSLLLIGVFHGFVYGILLLIKGFREDSISDKLLALILFTMSIFVSQWMLGFAGWYDIKDWHTTFMFYFPYELNFLLGPLFYCYFLASTNNKFSLRKKWKHFLPVLLSMGIYLFIFSYDLVYWKWMLGNQLPGFDGTQGPIIYYLNENIFYPLYFLRHLDKIHLIIYIIITLKLYYGYRQYLDNHFSNIEKISLNWFRNIVILFTIALVANLIKVYVSEFVDLSYIDSWYFYFINAVVIFCLGIQGYRQDNSSHVKLNYTPDLSKEIQVTQLESTKLDSEDERLLTKLNEYMQNEKPYLNADITIGDLATEINTNTKYLSKVINQTVANNFNDYINKLRVKEVEKRFYQGDHESYTFLSLALESGFNSKATFNRAFKKYTGKSPREYTSNLTTNES